MRRIIAAVIASLILSAPPASGEESPLAVNGATTISAAAARTLFEKGAVFVDVRKDSDWDAGRIPGAVHIELKNKFSETALSAVVKKDQEVVFYCNGSSCPRSSQASASAVGWGFTKVHYFRDGFPAWQTAGYPVE